MDVPQKEPLKNYLCDRKDRKELIQYEQGPWIPPPHVVKVKRVLERACKYGIQTLIETGTFEGEMVRKCLTQFRSIYSIELDHVLATRAAKRFFRRSHVCIIEGDSSIFLPRILEEISKRVLFWLDGHYSGGVTARGAVDTPLIMELAAIRQHSRDDHIILIDDARLMGQGHYPTFAELQGMLLSINRDYMISVRDDIVICEPPTSN